MAKTATKYLQEATALQEPAHVSAEGAKIENTIRRAIKRIQFDFCLPLLLENDGKLLHNFMDEEQVKLVRSVIEPSLKPTGETELMEKHLSIFYAPERHIMEDMFNNFIPDKTIYGKTKKGFLMITQFLYQNNEIVNFCDSQLLDKISEPAKEFLKDMNTLLNHIILNLKADPEVTESRRVELLKIYKDDQKLTKELKNLKKRVAIKEMKDVKMRAKMNAAINKLRRRRKILERDFNGTINKIKNEAKEEMILDLQRTEFKKEELVAKADDSERKLKTDLEKHIELEKELYSRGKSLREELSRTLSNFDATMSLKQAEYDIHYEEYSKLLSELHGLQEEFRIQGIEYETFMKENKDYLKAEREAKLLEAMEAADKVAPEVLQAT